MYFKSFWVDIPLFVALFRLSFALARRPAALSAVGPAISSAAIDCRPPLLCVKCAMRTSAALSRYRRREARPQRGPKPTPASSSGHHRSSLGALVSTFVKSCCPPWSPLSPDQGPWRPVVVPPKPRPPLMTS